MIKNKKGYSMVVLIIIIAVILIITATSIMNINTAIKDKEVSEFINDINEVRDYVMEFYVTNQELPVTPGLVSPNQLIPEQRFEGDSDEYYNVDLSLLGNIQLESRTRGYVVNEKTLNIYVLNERPTYGGVTYCTVTDELSGRSRLERDDVEIQITGNPLNWVVSAHIKVSVNTSGVQIKYASGVLNDLNVGSWHNLANNSSFEVTQNGIYTVYANANGKETYRKIVVSMIDDIAPVFFMTDGKYQVVDRETGIREILCKLEGSSSEFISIEEADFNDTDNVIVKAIDLADNAATQVMTFAMLKTMDFYLADEFDVTNLSGGGLSNTDASPQNWALLGEIADAISNDSSITSQSNEATVSVGGNTYTITVGETFKVAYEGIKKTVRVLGFNHDTLADGTNRKAGISFEFVDFLGVTTQMHPTNTNAGGWVTKEIYGKLNTNADAMWKGLSNSAVIKDVTKTYITNYATGATSTSNDKLWFLACSEIWNSGFQSGAYGYAASSEGPQYKFYKNINPIWDVTNNALKKPSSLTGTNECSRWWWLRSPHSQYSGSFCTCAYDAICHSGGASDTGENTPGGTLAPGFSIGAPSQGTYSAVDYAVDQDDSSAATWTLLGEIADAISNNPSITSQSNEATVLVRGNSYTIHAGELFKVAYGGIEKTVRVLGFNHDTLADGTNRKAGISFEFVDFLMSTAQMTTEWDNRNGWAMKDIYEKLNTNADAAWRDLSNSAVIKEVKKTYITNYYTGATSTSNDKLWLLACSEIVDNGYRSGAYGYANASEGAQYKYYDIVNATWNEENFLLRKPSVGYGSLGYSSLWWLRSPSYFEITGFCDVLSDGSTGCDVSSEYFGIAPGFSIGLASSGVPSSGSGLAISTKDSSTETWNLLGEIADAIADNPNITRHSDRAVVWVRGTKYIISVGDTFRVAYNGEDKLVRVMGFNHDTLADGTNRKAGISFEFVEFLMNSTQMHNTNNNDNGWVVKDIYSKLNTNANAAWKNLSNSGEIKQVKKTYITNYSTGATSVSNDKLWLLACSEIWRNGYQSDAYGYTKAFEGNLYRYYDDIKWRYQNNTSWEMSLDVIKKPNATNGMKWWLRSASYFSNAGFCTVESAGRGDCDVSISPNGIAPGFCIGEPSAGTPTGNPVNINSEDYSATTWNLLSSIANNISNNPNITSNSSSAIVTIGSNRYTINVGDTFKVAYNGSPKVVRVIGFNHDTLADGTNRKAGISFEFVDFLMETQMHNTNSNANGWVAKDIYGKLNTNANAAWKNLSNSGVIKEVKKRYITDYNTQAISTSNDKLWLLACSEIWEKSYPSEYYGYAPGSEGKMYKYYGEKLIGIDYDEAKIWLKKPSNVVGTASNGVFWWARSPYYGGDNAFCFINDDGYPYWGAASYSYGVAPGFSI